MNNNAEKQYELNKELAQMLKGGVIMDVTTPEQAKIAEEAGACAVMALERIPADIRAAGGAERESTKSKKKKDPASADKKKFDREKPLSEKYYGAQNLNGSSANAMLKIIEEPPEGVLFLLTMTSWILSTGIIMLNILGAYLDSSARGSAMTGLMIWSRM